MGLNISTNPDVFKKLLFGGAPSAMFGADPTAVPQDPAAAPQAPAPADAQPPSSTPPRGSVAEAMPQQQQAPTAAAPPSTPPQNAPIPQAPQPYHHGTLAKIMLGIGEAVGNPLATHIGERDRARQQEVDEYTRNQPYTQAQANRTAQAQDLSNLEKIAQTRRANVEADLAQQNLPMQEAAEKHYHELEDTWVSKAVPPEQFDTYAEMQLAAMPPAIARMVRPHLAGIKQLPQTGKGYKLNMQDDMPVSVESYGKTYQPDAKGGFGPEVSPQAVQDFTAAQKTHEKAQQGKVDVAKAEGQARANIEAATARGSNAALAQVPPHLIGPATDAATKAGSDFAQAQSVTQRLNAMMDAARKGNVVSYQLLPEEGALQVVTSQGIHRINMAEIQNYGGGSLWQKMQGHLGKALTGKSIPDSVLNDMAEMQKIQSEGSRAKYENTLKTINQNYGAAFQPLDMALPATGAQGGPTATGPNGHKIKVVEGKWVDATTGKPI